MKACPDRNETLMLDVYGELETEAARRWEAHLTSCAACRRERGRLQALIEWLRDDEEAVALSPGESAAMIAALHRDAERRPGRWRPRGKFLRALPALAAAATLVLAVWMFQERGPAPTPAPPAGSTVDIYRQLSEEDLEVVRNLDLLKQFQTIEKLNRVVNVSGDSPPAGNRKQGASRNDSHEVYA